MRSTVVAWARSAGAAFFAGILAVLVLVGGSLLTRAFAHSFYDYDCCSDKDCRPVEDGVVEEKADGVHIKGFTQVLKYDDHRLRWSKDDQDHVCNMGDALLCVYRKPKGM